MESRKNYEGNEHEGGPQFARIASSFDHRSEKISSPRSTFSFHALILPPSSPSFARRVATSPDALSTSGHRYAPEFRGSRVRRDKFYLTLPLDERPAERGREMDGEKTWAKKNDRGKNGGEKIAAFSPPISPLTLRISLTKMGGEGKKEESFLPSRSLSLFSNRSNVTTPCS